MYDGVVLNRVPSAAMMVQRPHPSLVYPVPCQILVKLFNTIRLREPNLVKRSRSPCQIQLIYPTWQMQLPAHLVPSTGLIRAAMRLADRYDFYSVIRN